ncbi:hypothetical protein M5689_024412 [Euphorbia peplus]|nr:hypothetical protein M5689_024412 [Euphorbia peplus]
MEAIPNPMSNKRPRVFDIDDGGSFERLFQECRRSVFGCTTDHTLEAEAMNLLQLRVVEGFVNRLSKDASFNKTTTSTTSTVRSCEAVVDQEKNKSIKLKLVLKMKPQEDTNLISDDVQHNMKKKAKKIKSDDVIGGMINQPKESIIKVGTKIIRFYDKGLEPPLLSIELHQRIETKGGRDIKLVIMKQLFISDLEEQQGRLSMPFAQIRDATLSFLTQDENTALANKCEMPVMLMEPCKYESDMILVRWRLTSSYSFVLRTNWNRVLQRNHFQDKYFKLSDVIQVWSFRVGPQLWFAIDKVWDAPH